MCIIKVLSQVDKRLMEVGSDRESMLQVTIYLSNLDDLPTLNRLWENFWPLGSAPARACIKADLVNPQYKIEMICVAAVGTKE